MKDRFSSREDAVVITQILPMHCLLLKANNIKLIWKKKKSFKLKYSFCCTQIINILCPLLFPLNWEERWRGQDEGEERGTTSSPSFSRFLFPTLSHMKKRINEMSNPPAVFPSNPTAPSHIPSPAKQRFTDPSSCSALLSQSIQEP